MKCEMVDELIQHQLDLSLSHEQRIQLEKHVELCSRCREELQSYKQLMELFEEKDELPELPADFTSRVMRALPEIHFKSAKSGGFGSGFESIVPYIKYAGIGIAAVFTISLTQMDLPFEMPWQKSDVPRQLVSTGAGDSGAYQGEYPIAHGELDGETLGNQQFHSGLQPMTLAVSGGVVHVKSTDGFQIVKDGQEYSLSFRDEVRTGAQASASIIYPEDAVRLRLKPRTRVQIARNSLRLYHGDSWINIVRKGTRFEVKTPNLIAAVRGTVFSVGVEGDSEETGTRGPLATRSTVSVFEGRVEVRSLTSHQPPVFVNASEEVQSKGLGLGDKISVSAASIEKWKPELDSIGLLSESEGTGLPNNSEVRPEESFTNELDR